MSEVIGKQALAKEMALAADVSVATADKVLQGVIDLIRQHVLAGATVSLPGLGRFERVPVSARTGRNPHTGAVIELPAGHKVRFRAAKALKQEAA